MAHRTDKKFNYSFRKHKKSKMTHPYIQENTSIKFDNYSELIIDNTSTLSSSSSPSQYYFKFNMNSTAIYTTTIILCFATWIFKKTTYVIRNLLDFPSFFFQIELTCHLCRCNIQRMLIRIPFRLILFFSD